MDRSRSLTLLLAVAASMVAVAVSLWMFFRLDTLSENVLEAKAENDEIKARLDDVEEKLHSIDGRTEEAYSKIRELSQELRYLNKSLAEKVAALEDKLEASAKYGEKLRGIEARIESLDSRLARLASREEDVEKRLEALKTVIEKDVKSLKQRLDDVESALSYFESRLASDEARIRELGEKLAGMSDRLYGLEDEVSSVERQISSLESELRRLASRLESLEARVRGLSTMIDEYGALYLTRVGVENHHRYTIVAGDAIADAARHDSWLAEFLGKLSGIYDTFTRAATALEFIATTLYYCRDPYVPVVNGEVHYVDDFLQLPNETWYRGCGDCEDLALLLYAVLDVTRKPWEEYYLIEATGRDANGQVFGHAAVLVKSRGAYYIVDPTLVYLNGYMGYLLVDIGDTTYYVHPMSMGWGWVKGYFLREENDHFRYKWLNYADVDEYNIEDVIEAWIYVSGFEELYEIRIVGKGWSESFSSVSEVRV